MMNPIGYELVTRHRERALRTRRGVDPPSGREPR